MVGRPAATVGKQTAPRLNSELMHLSTPLYIIIMTVRDVRGRLSSKNKNGSHIVGVTSFWSITLGRNSNVSLLVNSKMSYIDPSKYRRASDGCIFNVFYFTREPWVNPSTGITAIDGPKLQRPLLSCTPMLL